ncbi:MAG: soluble lytic murein transglycosylase [Hyphomonadaceae bacterium]|nr:MAG: soluble lytic murein transglycosylase [Hyphomonadaceae bacterium]
MRATPNQPNFFSFLWIIITFFVVPSLASAQEPPVAAAPPVVAPEATPAATPPPTSVPVIFSSEPQPVPVIMAPIIPTDGRHAMQLALGAVRARNWNELRRLSTVAPDDASKQAITWLLVSDEASDAEFSEQNRALQSLQGFPQMRELRMRMERNIENRALSPHEIANFLTGGPRNTDANLPITGEGKMALASAYLATGRAEAGQNLAKDAWRNYRFDSRLQAIYLDRFRGVYSAQDHDARADLLLWVDRTTQARALLPLLSEQGRTTYNAHLGIQTGEGAVLSGATIDDRGVKYERVKSLRLQGRNSEALNLLTSIDSNGLPEPGQEAIWNERRILLLEAIRSRRWQDGYQIASQHGLASGSKFAESEFSAGWIALRFLNQPDVALRHFQRFDTAVQTHMSKSRGFYWQGRAFEALGNQSSANAAYNQAATYPAFYYGQLAAARLAAQSGTIATLRLPPEGRATPADWSSLNARPMMQIAKIFSELGERDLFIKFAFSLDDVLETNGEHQALSEFARSRGENLVGIRVAKAGLNRGIIATEAAFPIIDIPRLSGYNQAEDAFSLAITRQESEFNPNAHSHAGARGLMQFMPATANAQARRMEIPHSTAWLTSRPQHNLTLGSAHLADLTNRFYGSYVLAIISYNAGPGRATQWIDAYGEIRGEDVDKIIDWIEMIPFSETRNYVQRVMENMQVYRARLNGDASPLRIYEDLVRGTKPPPEFNIRIMPGADAPGGPPPEPERAPANTPVVE